MYQADEIIIKLDDKYILNLLFDKEISSRKKIFIFYYILAINFLHPVT